jgi:hypothetical protein
MSLETLAEEDLDSDLTPSTSDRAHCSTFSSEESSNWISTHVLPHITIPFPSIPNIAGRIPFLHHIPPRDITEDPDEKGLKNPTLFVNPRRFIRVRPKNRRAPPPPPSTTSNKLELTRTTSTYPESLHIHGNPPDVRLQALVDSLLVPSMPKLHRSEDPFDCLNGEDVVILGGYRGSILRDVKTKKRLWVPLVRAGLNLRKVDLGIPLDEGADKLTEAQVIPDGMLSKMGPVDFSNKLITKLRELEKQGKCRVHIFGYDWRVSPHLISERLQNFLERLPCNHSTLPASQDAGALVLAHSMGGLIAHHALQSKPHLFSGVVYCGTPFIHCVNILGPLKRGDSLLANSDILSAAVNFSMRSSFVFLPESGECFLNRHTEEKYILDFFDYKTWLDYGLSPCVSDVGLIPEHHFPPHHPKKSVSMPATRRKSDIELSRTKSQPVKNTMPHPRKYLEPHMQCAALDGKAPKLRAKREHAIKYLKRTLEETRKYKTELFAEPKAPMPPIAVVYGVNTPTVRGALVESMDDIKTGNWWHFSYGPGDGVVLAKAAQLPPGFSAVTRVKTHRGHIQIMSDMKAMGAAIEAVILAKRDQDVEEYELEEPSENVSEETLDDAPVEVSGSPKVITV